MRGSSSGLTHNRVSVGGGSGRRYACTPRLRVLGLGLPSLSERAGNGVAWEPFGKEGQYGFGRERCGANERWRLGTDCVFPESLVDEAREEDRSSPLARERDVAVARVGSGALSTPTLVGAPEGRASGVSWNPLGRPTETIRGAEGTRVSGGSREGPATAFDCVESPLRTDERGYFSSSVSSRSSRRLCHSAESSSCRRRSSRASARREMALPLSR